MVAGRRVRSRVGADVEQLVADERADVEPVVVDRQQHDAGLELAAPDALGDRGGVAAQEPHGQVRVALQEAPPRPPRAATSTGR